MAEIKCTVCNRINDSKAERCWFCLAPLKKTTQQGADELPAGEIKDSGIGLTAEKPGSVPGENEPTPEEEVPGWLARVRQLKHLDAGQDPLVEGEVPDVESGEDLDWLKDLQSEADSSTDQSHLSQAGDEISKLTEPASDAQQNVSSEELLKDQDFDFNEGLPNEEKLDDLPTRDKVPVIGLEPDDLTHSTLPDEGETPALAPEEVEPTQPAGKDQSITDSSESEEISFPVVTDDADTVESNLEFLDNELPDWLAEAATNIEEATGLKSLPTRDAQPTDTGSQLEKGKIPSWLQAIQPGETVSAQAHTEEPEEGESGSGVLAGIQGTLSTANISSRTKKSQGLGDIIVASEHQQQNATMFQQMFTGNSAVVEERLEPQTTRPGNPLLRLFIILVLLAAVVLPDFIPQRLGVIPLLFPSEVVSTISTIQNLPVEKPVLLIAQFEAGLAGEIEWTSTPIVEHLLIRNLVIGMLSTNSVGSAILMDEIKQAARFVSFDLASERLVNFGYLPGGSIGLLSLAGNLRQTIPLTSELKPAWSIPTMQTVDTLSDFGAVILITDNADTLRIWVEQVQPTLDETPLLVVISAQAAPMVQPYYTSGQLDGFVAGMSGSLAYRQILQKDGDSARAFDRYQVVLVLLAVVIMVGGFASLVTHSGTPAKPNKVNL